MCGRRQRKTHSVMKIKKLLTMAYRYVRNVQRAEDAVKRLLLQFGYCRSTLVKDRKSRPVQDKTNDGDALLLPQAEKVFPVICSVKIIQLGQMQQPKGAQKLANSIVNDRSECQLRGGSTGGVRDFFAQ